MLTTIPISTHSYRVPLVTADVSASWTAEGAEITASDATLDELDITPSKLAALLDHHSELANDSHRRPRRRSVTASSATVPQGRSRLFTATTTNGPGGLPGVSGVTSVSGPATAYANVDPFSDAIYTSAQHNGTITAWVTNPATAQALGEGQAVHRGAIEHAAAGCAIRRCPASGRSSESR